MGLGEQNRVTMIIETLSSTFHLRSLPTYVIAVSLIVCGRMQGCDGRGVCRLVCEKKRIRIDPGCQLA